MGSFATASQNVSAVKTQIQHEPPFFFFFFKIFSRYNVCVTDFQEVKLFYILDGESSVND